MALPHHAHAVLFTFKCSKFAQNFHVPTYVDIDIQEYDDKKEWESEQSVTKEKEVQRQT